MKPETLSIAIAAPSPVPFVVGGAEKLWWGLQQYINENTAHHCELIKICTPESSFGDVINSYRRFFQLDLSHFDLVLTTKYPAWMLTHSNHHVYYQHPLRGLYELYPGPSDVPSQWARHTGVARILACLDERPLNAGRLLDAALELAHDPSVPADALALPGPLLRKIVHALDHWALARAARISAISQTVRDRPGYFPAPETVGVIHHPSNLQGFHDDGGAYLLTVSRLVPSKRVELILQAYMQARVNIPLKIAGRGPELPALQEKAKGMVPVEFTGFVSDRELVDLYARARAVIFVPEDEDLGLITLEAMHSGKPVVTCTDSGGAAELVRHGQTGWVCPPNTAHLARALQEAAADPQKTARMGRRARADVRDITWENTAAALLGSNVCMPAKSPGRAKRGDSGRPGLAVLSTFPVYPPRGGGQARIYNLYRALAADFEVTIVCMGTEHDRARSARLAPGLWETRVPMPPAFIEKSKAMAETLGMPAVDLACALHPELLPGLAAAAARAAADCDLVVLSHPYTLPLARSCAGDRLVYEAHNVEYDLKHVAMVQSKPNSKILRHLRALEQEACDTARCVMACSTPDINRLAELYGLDPSRAVLAPNGVDPDACPFVSPDERAAARRAMGLENTRLSIFLGSDYPPNIEAVEHIFGFAKNLPGHRFIVIGSVAGHFRFRPHPANVGFTGEIPDAEKAVYLACADAALNPVCAGSGTNLKMIEYIAAGLPVVSTHFGARGLDTSRLPVAATRLENFSSVIETLDMTPDRVYRGREVIEKNYSWTAIARELSVPLQKLANQ